MSAPTIAVSPTLSANRSKTGHLSCSGELQKIWPTCNRRDGAVSRALQYSAVWVGREVRRAAAKFCHQPPVAVYSQMIPPQTCPSIQCGHLQWRSPQKCPKLRARRVKTEQKGTYLWGNRAYYPRLHPTPTEEFFRISLIYCNNKKI